jgi:Tfp pilus assembly protein PilF
LAFLEENRLDEAEAEFLKLIDLAPDEPLGYANLGLVYLRMGRYEDAETQVDRALDLATDDPNIRLILATVYELTDRADEAREALERSLEASPGHVKSLYALAQLYVDDSDAAGQAERERYLTRIVEIAPGNLAARLLLVETLLRNDKPDDALAQMEAIRQQFPELPEQARVFYDAGAASMRAGNAEDALVPTLTFSNFLRVTGAYQAGILDLEGPGGALIGFPVVTFSQAFSVQAQDQEAVLAALTFTDATALAGLDVIESRTQTSPPVPVAVADYDGDGDQDIYVGSGQTGSLFRNDLGLFADVTSEAELPGGGDIVGATFADYDNDGHLDLFLSAAGTSRLLRNQGAGAFRDVAADAGVADTGVTKRPVFVDVDHDGDVDLYLASAGANRLYRNNGDGTFAELGARFGIAGASPSVDAAIGNFDEDADIDLVVANAGDGPRLYANQLDGRFEEETAARGLTTSGGAALVAAADYNNDGFLDLLVAADDGADHALFLNNGDGSFERDRRPSQMFDALRGVQIEDARFLDFDNDGWQDLLVTGATRASRDRGLWLFRNAGPGQFDDLSSMLPAEVQTGVRLATIDYGEDGDMDLLVTQADGTVRLLRNDGGDGNRYLRVQLVGLGTGSGKNNHFGIGAKLEVRAGALYQMRVVTEPTTHFGLGQRLKADVVRIQWTNGVPQNLFYPGSDQDLVEEQVLKGSCPFLYAWNGEGYAFVTDIMWRSALGMPLDIMASGGVGGYAPAAASQEYIRIAGDALVPKDGVYSLQITGELWETGYADEVKLIAVDHPDSVDVLVDERFVPPGQGGLQLYRIAERRELRAATDDKGNDLLGVLSAPDDVYVSNLVLTKYQGITELHDLVLELGPDARADTVLLFLKGWVFPTDASINVAMSQSDAVTAVPPHVQVIGSDGRWHTVIENTSFPSGKNKIVVVDLSGKFLTDDRRVRIRTNMQIYWDYAFFSTENVDAPVRMTPLEPDDADLHYRGFSRLYRKGGRYGPHWFDYDSVTTDPKWREITGSFTRYGDVTSLLLTADDQYVVFGPGDEITVEFDADQVPPLQPGWSRDFLLYSDSWLKDADLNTGAGQTVGPFPFHAMSGYPYGADESYPDDAEHRRYMRRYNTRRVPSRR